MFIVKSKYDILFALYRSSLLLSTSQSTQRAFQWKNGSQTNFSISRRRRRRRRRERERRGERERGVRSFATFCESIQHVFSTHFENFPPKKKTSNFVLLLLLTLSRFRVRSRNARAKSYFVRNVVSWTKIRRRHMTSEERPSNMVISTLIKNKTKRENKAASQKNTTCVDRSFFDHYSSWEIHHRVYSIF